MAGYEKWSYIKNEFIDKDTLKVEEQEGDLIMYHYFSTLRWKWCYAIVYHDIMIRECEDDIPYCEWEMATDLMEVIKNDNSVVES